MALALGVRSGPSWQPEFVSWKQRRPSRVRVRVRAMWGVQRPSKVELEAIESEEQFDRIVADSHETRVVIEWMAQWCRKCIYLKPKLESLAADFHQSAKFYFVDVNAVPKALVDRAGVTKMPTIQLWRRGEKREEVIGGHKAWLVVDQVREMIQKSP